LRLETKRMLEGFVNRFHRQFPYDALDCQPRDRGKIVGHDNRIAQQAGVPPLGSVQFDDHAAGMIGTEHATGNHSHNNLGQAGIQVIGLNDEGRTQFGRPQVE